MRQKSDQWYVNTLPRDTFHALEKCSKINFFGRGNWYLAGGTALALQSGHRRSVDLDFFTTRRAFDEKKAEETMNTEGDWVTTSRDNATLYGEFFGAKISLIAYPFFKPRLLMRKYGTVSILSPEDIAVMKIIAISQRGRKRDFFDLYWLCQNIQPLEKSIALVSGQYSTHQNLTHVLKSLVYFKDAETDPMPEINFKTSWKEVKSFFIKEIPRITTKIIGLR